MLIASVDSEEAEDEDELEDEDEDELEDEDEDTLVLDVLMADVLELEALEELL